MLLVTLRGPLHGGANEAAMDMIEKFKSPEDAKVQMAGMLERKEKIMGFGHAIYRTSDPRNVIIKAWSEKLAEKMVILHFMISLLLVKSLCGIPKNYSVMPTFSMRLHTTIWGIPTKLFTPPIFVCSRLTGWGCACYGTTR